MVLLLLEVCFRLFVSFSLLELKRLCREFPPEDAMFRSSVSKSPASRAGSCSLNSWSKVKRPIASLQSKLYHQSQTRCLWLKMLPIGQRNETFECADSQTWNVWNETNIMNGRIKNVQSYLTARFNVGVVTPINFSLARERSFWDCLISRIIGFWISRDCISKMAIRILPLRIVALLIRDKFIYCRIRTVFAALN